MFCINQVSFNLILELQKNLSQILSKFVTKTELHLQTVAYPNPYLIAY